MKQSVEKDKKKRLYFFKQESSRRVLKAISHNTNIMPTVRLKANLSLSALSKNSSLCRVKKRCVLTGRARFIVGHFNLSRMTLRKLIVGGFIPGLHKSSW